MTNQELLKELNKSSPAMRAAATRKMNKEVLDKMKVERQADRKRG
jgi:hypothetical protein